MAIDPISIGWKGPWKEGEDYKTGDVVSYQSSSYIAVVDNPEKKEPPKQGNEWNIICKGLSWKGAWASTSKYIALDSVSYNGASYIALKPIAQGSEPPTEGEDWNILASSGIGAMVWKGEWSVETDYEKKDVVSYLSKSYIAIANPPIGTQPTNSDYWKTIGLDVDTTAVSWVSAVAASVSATVIIIGLIKSFVEQSASDAITEALAAGGVIATSINAAVTNKITNELANGGPIKDAIDNALTDKITNELANGGPIKDAIDDTIGNAINDKITNELANGGPIKDAVDGAVTDKIADELANGGAIANSIDGTVTDKITNELANGGPIKDAIDNAIQGPINNTVNPIKNGIEVWGNDIADEINKNRDVINQLCKAVQSQV